MNSKKVIVTGGGGFVGKALCYKLKADGFDVVAVSRGDYPELRSRGIKLIRADISEDLSNFKADFVGAEAIFHTAAKVDMWGDFNEFYKVNVVGTKNLLQLARDLKISKFIYTSSPSVITDGKDLKGINESYPYPGSYLASYPETKAMAEKIVMEANTAELKTIALRPHLIWGPGDTNLVPTIIERAKAGRLMQVGDGQNMVDLCYIDDCVQAHIKAFEALDRNQAARGKAFFISQGEPVNLWNWINQILDYNSLPPVRKKISFKLAYFAAGVLEFIGKTFLENREPLLTRFLVKEMATDHYFDISRARKILEFEPKISIAEGMRKTFVQ